MGTIKEAVHVMRGGAGSYYLWLNHDGSLTITDNTIRGCCPMELSKDVVDALRELLGPNTERHGEDGDTGPG